jgi:hypothetical protein
LVKIEKSRVVPAKGEPMKSGGKALNFRLFVRFSILAVISFLFLCSNVLFAKPVDVKDAQKAVKGWLKLDSNPLGVNLGEQVLKTDVFADAYGEPLYYIVYLESGGFAIVSADDLIEPIVGFVSSGTFDPAEDNPLCALISRDMPNRIAVVRTKGSKMIMRDMAEQEAFEKAKVTAQGKWNKLHGLADLAKAKGLSAEEGILGAPSEPNLSDIRVSPLLQSKWDQAEVCGADCYNYYTPNNYVCGCVATAMAQLMRFHQYPTAGIGVNEFTIYVNGSPRKAYTRGSDSIGGPYYWSQMTLDPSADCGSVTGIQREAIGSLCYDAGVAVGMNYTESSSSIPSENVGNIKTALINTFMYSNAICGWNNGNNIGPGLNGMANPNLDAGYPVILAITGNYGGHAIVADGYGYNSATLYHHLNMGWTGQYDAWYNLPDIDTFFDTIHSCIYNIFKTGTGEIISGRITTGAGTPISDVNVTAHGPGGPYSTLTGSSGIYAFRVMSSSTYTISASNASCHFSDQNVTTGISTSYSMFPGNRCVNFVGTLFTVPIAFGSDVETLPAEANVIKLQASDDGFPNPPGKLTYAILSLPSHGILRDPCASVISSVPYTLANNGDTVIYTPDANGVYSFYFRVNDGGTPPCGGNSNIAGVTIDVCPPDVNVIDTDFSECLPAGWSIINGGGSDDTWTCHTTSGMIVDSAGAGTVDMDEQLITKSINCSNLQRVTLSFTHVFDSYSDEFADVDVSIDGGPWLNYLRYNDGNDASGLVVLDISLIADRCSDVRIRWHYYNANWEYYWCIDNVKVTAVSAYAPIVGDFDTDHGVDFRDFAILGSAWHSSFGQGKWNSACDIAMPKDGIINENDLAVLAENWLEVY